VWNDVIRNLRRDELSRLLARYTKRMELWPASVILTPASSAVLIASLIEAFSREVSAPIPKKRRPTGPLLSMRVA